MTTVGLGNEEDLTFFKECHLMFAMNPFFNDTKHAYNVDIYICMCSAALLHCGVQNAAWAEKNIKFCSGNSRAREIEEVSISICQAGLSFTNWAKLHYTYNYYNMFNNINQI